MKKKYKESFGEKLFTIINYTILLSFTLLCFYPFYYLIIYSFSDSTQASIHGVYLFPIKFSVTTMKQLLSRKEIYNAAFISASRAVVGTIFTVLCSSLFAYILSKDKLPFKKIIYRYVIITMYITAGLIPWYMTMKMIGLQNNYLLYILPGGVSAFFIILLKTYMESIPISLEESAMLDGASYFVVFCRIIFPLCKPILATVAIFSAVGQWNAWQDNFYLVSNAKLMTLQYLLYNILSTSQASAIAGSISVGEAAQKAKQISSMSIKMTMALITTIPILLVYPLMQKYFAKGIMLGAVKG